MATDKIESYTNSDGNHIVINNNGTLKYILLNSSSNIVRQREIDSGIEFNNYTFAITGYNNEVYIVYQKGDKIKVAKSTSAGNVWDYSIPERTIANNLCNGLDAIYDEKGLHIVWATQQENNFQTYYERYRRIDPAWIGFYNVSDFWVGGRPSVTTTTNKVHVAFNVYTTLFEKYSPYTYTRDYNFQISQWEAPQAVSISNVPPPFPGSTVDFHHTEIERIVADDNYVHVVLMEWVNLTNFEVWFYLMHKRRPINGTSWETERLVTTDLMNYDKFLKPVVTNNQRLNVIAYINLISEPGPPDPRLVHYYFENNTWYGPLEISNESTNSLTNYCISFSSNDIYANWTYWPLNNLYKSHYDSAPLAPEDYVLSIHQVGNNKYPKLTWSLNNEPDVRNKTSNAYKIERRTRNSGLGAWSVWSNIANLGGTVSTYIDYSINTAGGGDKEAEYRITAIDIGNNQSPQQSVVIIYGMGGLDKISSIDNVIEYELNQNYPNPFNPSTKISYSIKEDGFVTLKVYDILGVEIATLVNEPKTAGSYEAEFNAAQLPSGMYIYKLQSGAFTDVKKMMLTK